MAAPVITSSLTATSQASESFSYSIVATNTPTSYGATGLPSGLSINTSTGVISGTWPLGGPGTVSIGISATNGSGTDSETLVVTVTNPTLVQLTGLSGNCAKNDTIGSTAEIVYNVQPPLTDGPNGVKTLAGCGAKFVLINSGTHALTYDRKSTAAGTTGNYLASGASVTLEVVFGHNLWVGSVSGTTIAFAEP